MLPTPTYSSSPAYGEICVFRGPPDTFPSPDGRIECTIPYYHEIIVRNYITRALRAKIRLQFCVVVQYFRKLTFIYI